MGYLVAPQIPKITGTLTLEGWITGIPMDSEDRGVLEHGNKSL